MALNKCFHEVFESLGPGFNECVYHRAIEVFLRMNGIAYETERIVPIVFCNHTIGNVRIDLIVDEAIIVEMKAIVKLNDSARIQARSYLNLTGLKQAYLVNFPQGLSSKAPEIEVIETADN